MDKSIIIVLTLLLYEAIPIKGQSSYSIPPYDIVCKGVGNEGSYVAEITTYILKSDRDIDNEIRKAAAHGAIFKGLGSANGCLGQKPLCSNPDCEIENRAFFEHFFGSGKEYNRYVSIIEGSIRLTRIGKKYCVTAVVSIAKDDLRKLLEQKNIIQSLNGVFQ